MNDVSRRLAACYTGVVHDIMRAMGHSDFTLPPDVRPLLPDQPMAGPAFTIEGRTDRSANAHTTLLEWTGLLSKARAKAGHIWVCRPNTQSIALMGELSAETLMRYGLAGCVIDGLVRDAKFLVDMKFQTWCRGFTPRDIAAEPWLPKATDVDILIGEVWISPGDYLLADRDGCVRVPKAIVEEVITRSESAVGTENQIRTAIGAGMDPQEAYRKYGKF
jgi:regulator of RNase E activity RraA